MLQLLEGLQEGQVLQRLSKSGANLTLRGTASNNGPLHLTLANARGPLKGWNKRPVGQSIKGRYTLSLKGIPAGGPYRLELRSGADHLQIKAFYVGDVWLLAGQSNMEGVGNLEGHAEPHPLIRAFSMRHVWRRAEDPLHVLGESPDICHNGGAQFTAPQGENHRRSARKGTGVGIFFAREMLKRSGVPQGLICTAHGGTSMEQWSPDLKKEKANAMYASMMTSLRATGQPVAGMLWYQGESDTLEAQAAVYTTAMRKLVAATRRHLGQPRLPWIIVQIARVIDNTRDGRAWNSIQDQQRLLPQKIAHLETVSAIDLPLDDGIHIGSAGFPRLASRMARVADRLVHRNRDEALPPGFKALHPGGAKGLPASHDFILDVEFDHVVGNLCAAGEPAGFTFLEGTGEDAGLIFKTTLLGKFARLHLRKPAGMGLKLSYGHGRGPICNITDRRDFALPVFGPLAVSKPQAMLPFVTTWRLTDVITGTPPLGRISCPREADHPTQTRSYDPSGFINERPNWAGKNGLCYFFATLELPEPMILLFLVGYDAPFRLWVDGKPLFTDLKGINPCLPDKNNRAKYLTEGKHQITVAMDLDHGKGWGFFLRFARKDVRSSQVHSGEYVRPSYSA